MATGTTPTDEVRRLVAGAGFEPAMIGLWTRRLTELGYPAVSTPPRIRTGNLRFLRPTPLPVGLEGRERRTRGSDSRITVCPGATWPLTQSFNGTEAPGRPMPARGFRTPSAGLPGIVTGSRWARPAVPPREAVD